MTKSFLGFFCLLATLQLSTPSSAALKEGADAPLFKLKTHQGEEFDLNSRKGSWTVLYFYPKAETPGCTKQACTYRDKVDEIKKAGAEVYGVSTDTVAAQKGFHQNQKLKFTLLADDEGKVTQAYDVKMPVIKMSKRITYVIDPSLKIRFVNPDVDPVKDADQVMAALKRLRSSP